MNRMKLQRLLSALLLVFAVTIFVNSVYAQEGVLPAKPQEEVKPSLRSVTFDNFTSVTEEEPQPVQPEEDKESADGSDPFANFSADTDSESPKPPPATEFVGGVKYDSEGMIILGEGQTYELKTGREFQKFQTDTEILKAENDSMHKIFVTGKALGKANLHIDFTDGSSQSHSFRVKSDSDSFESIIQQLFPNHKLEIVPIKDSAVFLRGTVETAAEVEQIEEIAGEFWPSVHNHIQARQPQGNPPAQASEALWSRIPIPKGKRVITIPIIEWNLTPGGPNFNRVVSLFTIRKISKAGDDVERYASEETLIAHNLEVYKTNVKEKDQGHHLSLLVLPEQLNTINQATQRGLGFVVVSQVVNRNNAQQYPSDLDLKIEPRLNPKLTPYRPVIEYPIPNAPNADLEAIPLPNPGPGIAEPRSDSGELPEDQFLPGTTFDAVPPIRNSSPSGAPPVGATTPSPPIGLPGPAHIPFGGPSGVQPELNISPVTPFSTDNQESTSSLQDDVRALHSDVKNLIELLEKRQAKREKQSTREGQSEIVPQKGNVVLFFHAAWAGEPCKKMKPIVKKLQNDGLEIISVDIDQHPEIAKRYKVDSIPAFLHIENLHPYSDSKKTGVMTEESLRSYVRNYEPTIPMADQTSLTAMNIVQIIVNEPVPITSKVGPSTQYGSGLIIHQSGEKAYVLTTAHLFRKSSLASIVLFNRKNGRYEPEYRQGRLIASDDDADIALLEFYVPYMPFNFTSTPLATNDIKPGDTVSFAGFSLTDRQADEESRRRFTGKVESVDKFQGPANFQISEAMPMQGMSGSPVFDKDDRLCGIVFAADASEKQTVCTGLKEIKKLLNEASIELPEDRQVSFYMSVAR